MFARAQQHPLDTVGITGLTSTRCLVQYITTEGNQVLKTLGMNYMLSYCLKSQDLIQYRNSTTFRGISHFANAP